MPTKTLQYVLTGVDQSASASITKTAEAAEKSGVRIGTAFSKASQLIGGEVGEVLDKLGEGFETVGEHSEKMGARISAIGAVAAGVGAGLTMMGAAEKQATEQLTVAIQNAGGSMDDYEGKIEETVKSMEKYGDTAATTKNALMILTNATHDPQQAIEMMGTAADLAAAQHISLNDASNMLAKGLNGSTRIFKQYGIEVQKNADGTKDYVGAVAQLAQELHGQADAAADNFQGKLRELRAEITDHVAEYGQRFGPAITGIGVAMTAAGPFITKFLERNAAATVATAELGAAEEATAAKTVASTGLMAWATEGAATKIGVADTAIIANNERAAASFGLLSKGLAAGLFTAAGGLTVAALAMTSAADKQINASGQLVNSYKKVTESTDTSAKAIIGWAAANHNMNQTIIPVDTALKDLHITADELSTGVSGTDEEFSKFTEGLKEHGKVSSLDKDVLKELHKEFKNTAAAAADTANWVDDATAAAADNAAATKAAAAEQKIEAERQIDEKIATQNATDAIKGQNAAIKTLSDTLSGLGNNQITEAHAEDQFRDSVDAVTAAVGQNGTSLDVNNAKGRQNREVLINGFQAALAYADAQRKNGVSIDQVNHTLAGNVQQLQATAANAGYSKEQVGALVAQMGLTPSQINTTFNVNTYEAYSALDGAIAKAEYLHSLLNAGDLTDYLGIANQYQSQFGGGGHAGGSTYYEGGQTLVGERGPEVVDLPRGSQITPYSASGGSAPQMPPVQINIEVKTLASTPETQRALVGALQDAMRNGLSF